MVVGGRIGVGVGGFVLSAGLLPVDQSYMP